MGGAAVGSDHRRSRPDDERVGTGMHMLEKKETDE